ncbi:MAG: hypothetical protein IJX54_02900, partial [Oscillospiraceae bacterium]|nr:hypothetical protein [Oscillospiraceae bacterium]
DEPNAIVKGQGAIQAPWAGVYDITVDLNAMTITLTTETPDPNASSSPMLTTEWIHTEYLPGAPAGGDLRFGAAVDGKLIVTDKLAKIIYAWDENGQSTFYDLNSVVESAGTAITADDAGNVIVNTAFPNAASSTDWVIIPADGSAPVPVELDLGEVAAARCDQIGRVVGNVLGEEGGYMWIPTNGSSQIAIVKIVNGVQDMDYSQAATDGGVAINTSVVAQPLYTTVAEIDNLMDENGDLTPSFYLRSRSNPQYVYMWNADATEMEALVFDAVAESGAQAKNASQEGFETFKLQGTQYFVLPLSSDGTTNGRGTHFGVFDQDKNLVAEYNEYSKTALGQAFGSFFVVPNDDYSVYIYRWIAGNVAAKYKFTLPAPQAPEKVNMYIFGSFNNWDPATSVEMTMASEGVYTIEDLELTGDHNFGLSTVQSANWDEVNASRYGFEVDNTVAVLDEPNAIVKGQGAIQAPWAGVYDITVDLNAMTITLTTETPDPNVKPASTLYILGNVNGGLWNPANAVAMTSSEEGKFEVQVTVDANDSGRGTFIFTENAGSWDEINKGVRYGSEYDGCLLATDAAIELIKGSEASWAIAAGEYKFVVDVVACTVTATKISGIGEIEAESAAPVYYNLQGIEVANPENGKVYIVKRGNKVAKEVK